MKSKPFYSNRDRTGNCEGGLLTAICALFRWLSVNLEHKHFINLLSPGGIEALVSELMSFRYTARSKRFYKRSSPKAGL